MSEKVAPATASENFSDESEKELQLVSFKLAEEELGVEILRVREINRMVTVTPVPESPTFVEGVINLRGKAIPIVDLRKRMGLSERAHDEDTRIIVVELDDQLVGFVVDSVSEVLRIPTSITEPPPAMVAGIDEECITAVGKLGDRLLVLLDLAEVFSEEEQIAIKKAA